jgi:hypothetical protein
LRLQNAPVLLGVLKFDWTGISWARFRGNPWSLLDIYLWICEGFLDISEKCFGPAKFDYDLVKCDLGLVKFDFIEWFAFGCYRVQSWKYFLDKHFSIVKLDSKGL